MPASAITMNPTMKSAGGRILPSRQKPIQASAYFMKVLTLVTDGQDGGALRSSASSILRRALLRVVLPSVVLAGIEDQAIKHTASRTEAAGVGPRVGPPHGYASTAGRRPM